jgi:hypothetical protein
VAEVGERTEGGGHREGRCVAGRKKKTMHEDEGNIDHTQTLGGHVRLQVGLSPSQAYIVAYFKELKNCNGKI